MRACGGDDCIEKSLELRYHVPLGDADQHISRLAVEKVEWGKSEQRTREVKRDNARDENRNRERANLSNWYMIKLLQTESVA